MKSYLEMGSCGEPAQKESQQEADTAVDERKETEVRL